MDKNMEITVNRLCVYIQGCIQEWKRKWKLLVKLYMGFREHGESNGQEHENETEAGFKKGFLAIYHADAGIPPGSK